MKNIANQIVKLGWSHHLLARSGPFALYHRMREDGSQSHYEVIRIACMDSHIWPDGSVTPAHEHYPGAGQWGQHGWTYSRASHHDPLSAARAKMAALCSRRCPLR